MSDMDISLIIFLVFCIIGFFVGRWSSRNGIKKKETK